MAYESILVYQSLEENNDARLAVAAGLAQRFDAKLIGVGACAASAPAYQNGVFTSAVVAELRSQTEERLKRAADQFNVDTKGRVREVEWRQALEKPTSYVAQQARAADLIVIGADGEHTYHDPFTDLDPGELIMQAGRPVLMVPPEVLTLDAEHVVVAWKDTREARRAVLDALPLLQAATDVTVFEIVGDKKNKAAQRTSEDVANWLCRHNICATAHEVVSDYDSYGAFEGLLLQNAADLIVAGAYGHSRLQEWIFGGITRDLLMKSRYCCLFSN